MGYHEQELIAAKSLADPIAQRVVPRQRLSKHNKERVIMRLRLIGWSNVDSRAREATSISDPYSVPLLTGKCKPGYVLASRLLNPIDPDGHRAGIRNVNGANCKTLSDTYAHAQQNDQCNDLFFPFVPKAGPPVCRKGHQVTVISQHSG